eukprot:312026-Rhodomonas_salina.2
MLVPCSNRFLRSCLHTLSPTTPRSAGQACANTGGGNANRLGSQSFEHIGALEADAQVPGTRVPGHRRARREFLPS